eukprot:19950-Heterococcus_DN1.PRE.1
MVTIALALHRFVVTTEAAASSCVVDVVKSCPSASHLYTTDITRRRTDAWYARHPPPCAQQQVATKLLATRATSYRRSISLHVHDLLILLDASARTF